MPLCVLTDTLTIVLTSLQNTFLSDPDSGHCAEAQLCITKEQIHFKERFLTVLASVTSVCLASMQMSSTRP